MSSEISEWKRSPPPTGRHVQAGCGVATAIGGGERGGEHGAAVEIDDRLERVSGHDEPFDDRATVDTDRMRSPDGTAIVPIWSVVSSPRAIR